MGQVKLLCTKPKAPTNLTYGDIYEGNVTVESAGVVLRVKDDSGRWSKYGVNTFECFDDPTGEFKGMGGKVITYAEAKELQERIRASMIVVEAIKKPETAVEVASTETVEEEDDGLLGLIDDDFEVEVVEFNPAKAIEKPVIKKVVEDVAKGSLNESLKKQGVPDYLIKGLAEWRKQFTVDDSVKYRIPHITQLYDGAQVWAQCITAILSGKHLLLSAGKATGKNTLANSLAFACQRPIWDGSFHTNLGADELIGTETFKNGNVVFNPGIAYLCGIHGGFGVLDEINMAKDNAISVLNSILDERRVIDVPGYERLKLHEATRFIGTMNYGYSGTKPLNEALVSRFVLPDVREMNLTELVQLLSRKFNNAKKDMLKLYAGIFEDLQKKAQSGEISTACVDLRGIQDALAMTEIGMNPNEALQIAVTNKAFEAFERTIVRDTVSTRIPASFTAEDVFGSTKAFVVDFSK